MTEAVLAAPAAPAVAGPVTGAAQRPLAMDAEVLHRRALSVWPRLDRSALRRCGTDVGSVAALVERRSNLPREAIIGILTLPRVTEDEIGTWFG